MANEEVVDEKIGEGQAVAGEGDAGNGGAGDPANEQAPAFDPSTIDLNDPDAMSSLTDDQISEVEKYNKEHPTPEPGTEQDTPGKDTAAGAEAAAAEKAKADATKYAGKYATTDDLAKGVNEIAKKLGIDVTAFVEAAKASGEFKTLESLYKQYEKTLSEKGSVTTDAGKTPGASPATDTKPSDTFNPNDPQVANAVDRLTLSQIAQSNLAQRMQAKGYNLPTNMEEFDALAEVNPYFAMEFKSTYEKLYGANLEQAKGYFEARNTVEGANAKVVDTDTQAINAMATEHGFKISPEEIAAVKAKALANPANYEDRYGHKFLRANAIRDEFLISSLAGKVKEIALTNKAAGRGEAIEDLSRHSKKEIGGLGASKAGSRTRAIPKMPDLNDPDVVASLPTEALDDPEGYFKKQGFR